MFERENIRIKKERGDPWPWTLDPILQKYKFTNVQRKNDRTTRALVEEYYTRYVATSSPDVVLYNCGLYRYFGTIEWARAVGWQRRHDLQHIVRTAKERMNRGERVFTGAYIVTNCGEYGPKERVVGSFIGNLWDARRDIVRAFCSLRSWQAAYKETVKVHGWGGKGFYAKEALQDMILCYPGHVNDEYDWSPVGPGARRGINRLLGRPLKFTQAEDIFIEELLGIRDGVTAQWNKKFDEPLSAHDVQFCLCEFDKYERVRLGEGRPRSLYHVRAPMVV
jgi:hypothetical protein